MKTFFLSALLGGLCAVLNASAQTPESLESLSRAAVATNPNVASNAIVALRAVGPRGLQTLLTVHAETIARHSDANPPRNPFRQPDADWERVRYALDQVGQQRDCFASQLYWFTDFDAAQTAVKVAGKPILSLRLLGQLDEEFSCANSRFFRTTLYANEEVARYLRDHFVLHWKSVRPVPRITIDFGDGRKLERTITGNSIHYILLADGTVVDALPGLYGAKAFLRGLERAVAVSQQATPQSGLDRKATLANYHRTRLEVLDRELQEDLTKVSTTTGTPTSVAIHPAVYPANSPTATIAVGKGNVERPILDRMPSPKAAPLPDRTSIDDAIWQQIASLHADDATLDTRARKLIDAKGPNAFEAGRVALAKSLVENPMLRKMRAFERSISEDTVRNEYQLHRQLHEWLAATTPAVDDLNRKVYAELFLTPDSDPWLGLLPADSYAALEDDGLSQSIKK